MATLKEKAQTILNEKTNKILPENIKKDIQIFDVTGTYDASNISEYFKTTFNEGEVFDWKHIIIKYPTIDISNLTSLMDAFNSYDKDTLPEYINNWSFDSITNMSGCFSNCTLITDLSFITLNNVQNLFSTFSGCYSLASFPTITSNEINDIIAIFQNCTSMTTIPNLNTSNITDFTNVFSNCNSLLEYDNNFDTSKGISYLAMFSGCNSLKSIKGIDFSNITDSSALYDFISACTSLQYLDLSTLILESLDVSVMGFQYLPTDCKIIVANDNMKNLIQATYPQLTNIFVIGANHTITIEDETIEIQNMEPYFAGETIHLKSSGLHTIMSFKVNGNLQEGNSFVLPDEDVTITDIVKQEQLVYESEHYNYGDNKNEVIVDATIEDATNIQLKINYNFENGVDGLEITDGLGNTAFLTSSLDYVTTKDTEYVTINISGNYVKIKFITDGSICDRYGYKIEIVKLNEEITEPIFPNIPSPNISFTFTTNITNEVISYLQNLAETDEQFSSELPWYLQVRFYTLGDTDGIEDVLYDAEINSNIISIPVVLQTLSQIELKIYQEVGEDNTKVYVDTSNLQIETSADNTSDYIIDLKSEYTIKILADSNIWNILANNVNGLTDIILDYSLCDSQGIQITRASQYVNVTGDGERTFINDIAQRYLPAILTDMKFINPSSMTDIDLDSLNLQFNYSKDDETNIHTITITEKE